MPEFILDSAGIIVMPDARAFSGECYEFSDLDPFTQGYIGALFFTWPEDEGDYIGGITSPGFSELAPETLANIIADCAQFQRCAAPLLAAAYGHEFPARVIGDGSLPDSHRPAWEYDAAAAGRDLWFTRCGHGVGFWDRELGDISERLSDGASAMGNLDQYLGDDGLVYLA